MHFMLDMSLRTRYVPRTRKTSEYIELGVAKHIDKKINGFVATNAVLAKKNGRGILTILRPFPVGR